MNINQMNEKWIQEYKQDYYRELEARIRLEKEVIELKGEIIRLRHSAELTEAYCKSINYCREIL